MEALRKCWAVQGTSCGRLLAAALPDLVPRLRRFKELDIDDATAALLLNRAKLDPRGRSHTKPGTLLKDSIPMRTWAEWDDARPGFVEIDLVGHEGGNSKGVQLPGQILLRRRYTRIPNVRACTVPKVVPVTCHCGGRFGTTRLRGILSVSEVVCSGSCGNTGAVQATPDAEVFEAARTNRHFVRSRLHQPPF